MPTPSDPSSAQWPTLEVRNRQIAAVHTISRLLYSTLDLDERLRHVLSVSAEAVCAAAGTIFLHRETDDRLVFQYVFGPKERELHGYTIGSADGVVGMVFRSGEPRITNRPAEQAGFRADVGESIGFRTESIVTVPIKVRAGRPLGVIQLLNKQDGEFTQSDLEVLEIVASVAATAIENARLHRDAQLAAVAHAVGEVSHDIKNKVTPIAVCVDTLEPMIDDMCGRLDEVCEHSGGELADEIRGAAGDVRGFYAESFTIIRDQVQEIQDYTRLIADAVKNLISEPQLEQHEIGPIIERQLDALEPGAHKRKVRIVRQFGQVPICWFDRVRVERAVYNLVNNAVPETPEGGMILVRTDSRPEGEFPDGGYLLIEVQDTGRGIPKPLLDRILTGEATSTKPGGTGLGTRIVYNAVAAQHGIFEGESKEGEGTTFRIKLPLLLTPPDRG